MSKDQVSLFDQTIAKMRSFYTVLETRLTIVKNSNKLNGLCWTLVILFFFSILLLLNVFTPMTADDFGYQYVHAENIKITSFADIIHSQTNHYYQWGGRSVVHALAEALLLLPPLVIDLLNSLVYLGYVFLIYYHIKGRGKHNLSLFIVINFAIWFIQPAFGDTILWITGSANYLWGTSIILLFLLPYRLYAGKNKKGGVQMILALLFFAFGIVSGWTNENTAGAMLIMIILFYIYYRSNKWTMPVWAIGGFLGAVVGYVIMIIAPGNTVRAGDAAEQSLFLICYRLFMNTLTLVTDYGVLNLLYLTILVLFWYFTKGSKKDTLKLSFIYFIGVLAGVYVMIFSPSFPPRAWFGVITYNVIAVGVIFYNLNYEYKFLRQIRLSILLIGTLAFFFTFYSGMKDIYSFYVIYKQREVLVEQAKKEGAATCEFDRFISRTKFVHTEDPTSNFMMNRYYGIDITFRKYSQ